jgi:hypothetical protein
MEWISLAPTGWIFMKWDSQVFLKNMTRVIGTLSEDVFTFMRVSHWILLRMRSVSDKSCRKNRGTHFMFSNFFPITLVCDVFTAKNFGHFKGNFIAMNVGHFKGNFRMPNPKSVPEILYHLPFLCYLNVYIFAISLLLCVIYQKIAELLVKKHAWPRNIILLVQISRRGIHSLFFLKKVLLYISTTFLSCCTSLDCQNMTQVNGDWSSMPLKRILKRIILHSEDVFGSVPVAYSVFLKEFYENLETFLPESSTRNTIVKFVAISKFCLLYWVNSIQHTEIV